MFGKSPKTCFATIYILLLKNRCLYALPENRVIKVVLAVITISILICLISIWVSYNWLTVSYFTVTDSKISQLFRIVLISDTHGGQVIISGVDGLYSNEYSGRF